MIINGFGGSSGGSIVGDNQARIIRNHNGEILYRINTSASYNSRLGYKDYFNASESVVLGTYTCNAGFSMSLNSTQGTSGTDLTRYGVYQTASYTLPNYLWGVPGKVVAKYTDNSGLVTSKDLWTLSSDVYNTNSRNRVNVLIKSYYNYPLSQTSQQSTGTGYSPQSITYDHWGLSAYEYSSDTWAYIGTATSTAVVIDDSHKFQVEFFNAGKRNNNADSGAITFTNIYTWTVTFKFFPCMLY